IDVESNAVVFEDGTSIEIPDVIIYATGYLTLFPFIRNADDLALQPSDIEYSPELTNGIVVHDLYKYTIYSPNPTLAILGLPWRVVPFPMYQYQSLLMAQQEWDSVVSAKPGKKRFDMGLGQVEFQNDILDFVGGSELLSRVRESWVSYAVLINASQKSPNYLARELQRWRPPSAFDADLFLSALSELQPQQHTLVCAQILTDALNTATSLEQVSAVDPQLTRFISDFDMASLEHNISSLNRLVASISRLGDVLEVELACEWLVSLTMALNKKMAAEKPAVGSVDGVEVLGSNANRGVRPTMAHLDCLLFCLYSRRRDLHLAVLDNIISVQFTALGSLAGSDRGKAFMQYHYHAGMVAVGVGRMEQAIQLWKLVFAVSLQNVSAIQVATYKRLVLISLLEHGKKPRLPSFYPNVHVRDIEAASDAYVSLADAYANDSTPMVLQRLASMSRQLSADENASLAQRVLRRLPLHQIRKTASVYASMRVVQLAEKIGFASHPLADGRNAVQALAEYIAEMQDPAVQLQGDVVVFVPDTATVSVLPNHGMADDALDIEARWAAKIKDKVEETERLRSRLAELDQHLALTEEYVTHARD
ncbi:hypothetical protein EC988_005691, partial [Linderina pennispora]